MIRGLQTMKISKPQHLRIEENNAKLKITLSLDSKMVMYGEYYRLDPITDMLYITAFSTVQFVLMCWRCHHRGLKTYARNHGILLKSESTIYCMGL